MTHFHYSRSRQQGNVLIIVMVLFVVISLSIGLGLVAPVVRAVRTAQDDMESARSYYMAESGVEDVYYRLQNSKQTSSTQTLVLGTETTTTTLTSLSNGNKQIVSLGSSQNRNRSITTVLRQGTGASFNYGLQVGRGGISLTGTSGINGNVYSNGDIYGSSGTFITGSAIAANSAPLTTDQSNGSGVPSNTISFGDTSATQDVAQGFVVSTANPLNKVQLYLQKTGSPSNATVYIMTDSGGVPSGTFVASGTLSASLVGASYGWIDVTFTSQPTLQTNTPYWIVVDANKSASNYYTIGANVAGYANGVAKIGARGGPWNATTPSNLDAYFNLYLGGQTATIYGDSSSNQFHVGTSGSGIAKAHTVNNTNATGTIYCQSGTGNNTACNTSQADPTPADWPISNANINDWKNQAAYGGVQTGDISLTNSQTLSLGPKKVVGNLSISGSAALTVTGTLWITGDLSVGGSGTVSLSSAYGSSSGVIIVDGKVSLSGSSPFAGSGTTGSYILLVSTSDCPTSSSCSGANAITISGSAGAVVLVAQNGTISFTGSSSAKEATGYSISLSGSATVTYESGLANLNFSNGPSGSWNISSWKEN